MSPVPSASPHGEILWPPDCLSGPLLSLFQFVCFVLGQLMLDTRSKCDLTSAEQKGVIPSLGLLAVVLQRQPGRLLAVFATRAHRWLTFSLLSTKIPRFLPPELLPSWSVLGLCCWKGFYLSQL